MPRYRIDFRCQPGSTISGTLELEAKTLSHARYQAALLLPGTVNTGTLELLNDDDVEPSPDAPGYDDVDPDLPPEDHLH